MTLRVKWKEPTDSTHTARGVSLDEAATVLGDPFSRTIVDPAAPDFDRSSFVTMGLSNQARMLVVAHVDLGETVRIISARRALQKKDGRVQSRPEYDFRNGVRGKYASRYWDAAACRLTRNA